MFIIVAPNDILISFYHFFFFFEFLSISEHQKCCKNDLGFASEKLFSQKKKLAYSGTELYLSGKVGQSAIKEQR